METQEIENPESLQKLADLIEQYDIGYTSVQVKKMQCSHCGYESTNFHLENCPKCGNNL